MEFFPSLDRLLVVVSILVGVIALSLLALALLCLALVMRGAGFSGGGGAGMVDPLLRSNFGGKLVLRIHTHIGVDELDYSS